MRLEGGSDFRRPELRREVFLRFYDFHLRYRSHPGGVYYLLPYLRDRFGWDTEQTLWFAFLNGNTQHPVTSLLLHRVAPTPADAGALLGWFQANYGQLAFDTDRRYWKRALPAAVAGYLRALGRDTQADYWAKAATGGFAGVWTAATSILTFGRLSAFSYAEYLRIAGVEFDCDTLMLDDRQGSRSHRNGLCIVLGLDELDWHASNPGFDGHYSPALLEQLTAEADGLLADARARAWVLDTDYQRDVSLFTLESALCTYKSWHRPNRRYPGVYNDMLHDRIVAAQQRWPSADLDVFWDARAAALPPWMRLEDTPGDPGCVPAKQNHYRRTGQLVTMGRDDPVFYSDFDRAVDAGLFGRCR